jgi:quercetin dioxygenase-like cupin family protein
MTKFNLNDYFKGWFIGNFDPSIIKTYDFEVAIKKYKQGDYEQVHYHKIATEITVIVLGKVIMNNIEYVEGDIIKIDPNESTDFKCLTDVTTVVIKTPCVKNDKYE